MTRSRLASALAAAAIAAALPVGGAGAQTAPGALAVPPAPSRQAPGAGTPGPGSRAKPAAVPAQRAPKLSAAERAEQLKLEHDLHICIGC